MTTYRISLTTNGYTVLDAPSGRIWVTGPAGLVAADPLATIPPADRAQIREALDTFGRDFAPRAIRCGTLDDDSERRADALRTELEHHRALLTRMDDPNSDL
jgi:hypothetical protein